MEVTTETDAKVIMPQLASIAGMLGINISPKPKWMPNWLWQKKKRRQRENAMMQWKPVFHEPTKEQVAMMIAEEFRDFAEMVIGFSHVDPEKSAISRKRSKGGTKWIQHFKYDPPKQKKMTPGREKRILRKAMRETDKTLGIGV